MACVAAAITVALAAPTALSGSATAVEDSAVSESLTGTVVELVRESRDSGAHADETDLALATDTGFVALSDDGLRLTPGQRVTVTGERDGHAVEVTDVITTRAARADTASADIDRKIYVGIVSPAGYTVEDNTTTVELVQGYLAKASAYWSGQTGGQIRFSYAGTIPKYVSRFGCGRTQDMWNEATAKFAAAGVDVTGIGDYLLLVGPPGSSASAGCAYGLGTLGALDAERNAIFVSDASQSLYAHELGHNLGLAHASALRCTGTQDGAWDGRSFPSHCSRWRYEDLLDVMGYSGEGYGEGNLNSPHLDDLGLDPTAIRAVSGPATVTVPPLSRTMTPGRGLRVTDTNGVTYYVEYRTATGLDSVAEVNPFRPSLGVLIYREDPGAYRNHGSYHLDATPHDADDQDYDRALLPGTTFTSAAGTLSITTVSQDADGAVLEIVGGAEPARTVTLSGPAKVRRNDTVTLTATVLSETNLAISNSLVSFQRKVGSTWETVRTSLTTTSGYARATVRLRRSTTFRVATAAPSTSSKSVTVRVYRAGKKH